MKHLSNEVLYSTLKHLVASERKIIAQILSYIQEVDRRKLYLGYSNCTSLFGFLVQEMGYTKTAAQRRVVGARTLNEVPEVKRHLESGDLNLSQVSLVVQCVSQKKKEDATFRMEKRELFDLVKNKSFEESQVILAQKLDLKPKTSESVKIQKDESVRVELTLSKEQVAGLKRVKELISHIDPNPSMSDLVGFLAQAYIERKDPLVKKVRGTEAAPKRSFVTESKRSSVTESKPRVASELKRKAIRMITKRHIFQKHPKCQWPGCVSRFQLQIDHIHPVWRGGGNDVENLQILCRAHNRLKYEREDQPES